MDSVFWNSFSRSLSFAKGARGDMMENKAELTTKQLVTIIILVVSFIVILFLILRLNLGETTDKEICHNSVLLKGQRKLLAGPLNCRTNYLCISGGGDCEGITPTSTVEVDPENEEEIMKAIADEMTDCWWMFGEGEVNYLGVGENTVWGKNSCAICSIVEFDGEVINEGGSITYREFYNYLNSLEKDSGSYFSYLYDSQDIDEFQNEISYLEVDLDNDAVLGEGEYAIVTGVKNNAVWGLFKKDIFIWAYYLKSNDIVSELECDEFITKA